MNKLPSLTLLFLLSLLLAFAGVGVPRSYAEGITEEQATAIRNELKQIRQLLERQQTRSAAGTVVNDMVSLVARDAYVLGSEQAQLTLVEFTDYQCPFCNLFHLNTFPELKKQFVDTGLVRFVSRDLPLNFHEHAFVAARAARCAGEQDRYWEVRDWLSSYPDNLTNDAILSAATRVIKPKPLESLNHFTVPVSFVVKPPKNIPAKKAGRTAVRQKKIGGTLAPPSDSCRGLVAPISV